MYSGKSSKTGLWFWNATFILAAFSVIIPKATFSNIFVGVDDIVVFLILPAILIQELTIVNVKRVYSYWLIVGLFVVFILLFLILGLVNSHTNLGRAQLPTEIWQYIKRLAFFSIGFVAVRSLTGHHDKALMILFYALLAALLIGIVQLSGTSIGDYLANLYGRTDAQIERLVDRPIVVLRNFGVAGHPNAWGGFCVFAFALSAPAAAIGIRRLHFKPWLVYTISVLSLVNIVFSGSRAAIAALVVVFLVLLTWYCGTRGITARSKLTSVLLLPLLVVCVLIFFGEKIAHLIFRFALVIEQSGGARIDQISSAVKLLEGPYDWIFGVGNAAQRELSVIHGVEVEPVYLLVNYGMVGLLLLLAVMGILTIVSIQLLRINTVMSTWMGLALLGSIAGYMTFWFGYFFFQEVFVGAVFWIYAGVALGFYQKRVENF